MWFQCKNIHISINYNRWIIHVLTCNMSLKYRITKFCHPDEIIILWMVYWVSCNICEINLVLMSAHWWQNVTSRHRILSLIVCFAHHPIDKCIFVSTIEGIWIMFQNLCSFILLMICFYQTMTCITEVKLLICHDQ